MELTIIKTTDWELFFEAACPKYDLSAPNWDLSLKEEFTYTLPVFKSKKEARNWIAIKSDESRQTTIDLKEKPYCPYINLDWYINGRSQNATGKWYRDYITGWDDDEEYEDSMWKDYNRATTPLEIQVVAEQLYDLYKSNNLK